MTRLSVALRPRYREALELIARDRQTSLSQALEYLIAVGARQYKIEGVSVMDTVTQGDDAVSRIERLTWPDLPNPAADAVAKAEVQKHAQDVLAKFADSRGFRILQMQASLRRPEENYFVEVFEKAGHLLRATPGAYDGLLENCIEAYKQGIPVDVIVETLKRTRDAVIEYQRQKID
ncbi:hypothetical protein [Achromobacter sp.]|uniref:hypothetical protein n=1 Tax=Achromobacter sp. TaxID=134375 RepID=UPI0028A5F74F|nr:hypothetical protein [Achromobacter sp.]